MELRQLKTFQVVGKLLSFNRAADTLNYAQSTVSVQIRSLEEELGVPLFDRLGKRIILTEAGQTLMRYSQKMLDIEKETLTEVAGQTQSQGSLSIRIPQSLSMCYLPTILSRFRLQYPNISFDINSCSYHSLGHELKSGITDLAFLLAESVSVSDLKFEFLKTVPLFIVAMPRHPLSNRQIRNIRDLQGETLILPKHDCGYRMAFEQMLIEEKVKIETIIEMNSVEAIKQCVHEGVGVTILPEISIKKELISKELSILPLGDKSLETGILMIWHKDKWISPVLQAFIDTVRDIVA